MTNIHVRGLELTLMQRLKRTAAHQRMSVNTFIIATLKQALGFTQHRNVPTYHDLDPFVGKWKPKEAAMIMKNIADFEKIDEDLWK